MVEKGIPWVVDREVVGGEDRGAWEVCGDAYPPRGLDAGLVEEGEVGLLVVDPREEDPGGGPGGGGGGGGLLEEVEEREVGAAEDPEEEETAWGSRRGLAVVEGARAALQASQVGECQINPFNSSSCRGLGGGHVFTPRLACADSQASQASSLAGVPFGPRVH